MVILRINLQISCFMITKFVESFLPLQLSPFKLAISKSDKRYTYFLPLWREQTIDTTPKFRHDDIFIQCFLFFLTLSSLPCFIYLCIHSFTCAIFKAVFYMTIYLFIYLLLYSFFALLIYTKALQIKREEKQFSCKRQKANTSSFLQY